MSRLRHRTQTMPGRPDEGDLSRHHTHLHARRWAAARRQALDRDRYRCRSCGRAGRLECDHVIPLERSGDPLRPREPSGAVPRLPYRQDGPREPAGADACRGRVARAGCRDGRLKRGDVAWGPPRSPGHLRYFISRIRAFIVTLFQVTTQGQDGPRSIGPFD